MTVLRLASVTSCSQCTDLSRVITPVWPSTPRDSENSKSCFIASSDWGLHPGLLVAGVTERPWHWELVTRVITVSSCHQVLWWHYTVLPLRVKLCIYRIKWQLSSYALFIDIIIEQHLLGHFEQLFNKNSCLESVWSCEKQRKFINSKQKSKPAKSQH